MTENTNPLLSNTGRGFTVSYRGRFLYSAVDPEGRAERIASSVPKEEQTLYFIPSPLLFYGCKTILKNLPQTSRIFCVEADEALMSLSLSSAETIIEDERVSYIRTADPLLAGRYLEERIGAWRFRRVRLIPLNGGYALYKTVYDAIEAQLDRVIQTYWQNRMTLMHMGPLWVKNVFLNLLQLPHTLPLSALHTEQPVWVAGAGESLERALPLMKAHREEFFLIAVDTALPCLTQSGITPDLILALEAQYANLKDFIGFANRSVPLCADISSFPGVLRLFQGNKFLFASRFADTALLSRLREHFSREHFSIEEIPPLGSVGVVAVKMGLDMTEAPLIVSGLDFSYTPGKTHSRGAPVHTAALSAWTRIRPAEWREGSAITRKFLARNIGGKEVLTDPVLSSYSRILARMLSGNERVFVFGDSGLPIGARVLETEGSLSAVLASRKAGKIDRLMHPVVAEKASPLTVDTVREFLDKEYRGLKTLEEGILKRLKTQTTEHDEELIALLRAMDFVYIHFPDTPLEPSLDPGFLTRCRVSAAHYADIIRHITS